MVNKITFHYAMTYSIKFIYRIVHIKKFSYTWFKEKIIINLIQVQQIDKDHNNELTHGMHSSLLEKVTLLPTLNNVHKGHIFFLILYNKNNASKGWIAYKYIMLADSCISV